MAGAVEGVDDESAVAGPDVGVGVTREVGDVIVAGSDDGAAVVAVEPGGQNAPPVELGCRHAQEVLDGAVVLFDPHPPVVAGSVPVQILTALHYQVLAEAGDLFVSGAAADPVG